MVDGGNDEGKRNLIRILAILIVVGSDEGVEFGKRNPKIRPHLPNPQTIFHAYVVAHPPACVGVHESRKSFEYVWDSRGGDGFAEEDEEVADEVAEVFLFVLIRGGGRR